jgi:hypothetical protein
VAGGALYAKAVEAAHGLFTPLRFERPLRNEQLGGAAGLRFQRNGNARDLFQSLLAFTHVEAP